MSLFYTNTGHYSFGWPCAGHWVGWVHMFKPFKICSQFAINLWVSWTQAPLVFRARCLGAHHWSVGLNSCGAFVPQGEAPGFSSLSAGWERLCQGFGLWWDCLSLPCYFHVGFFSLSWCVGVIQLVIRSSSEESMSYVAVGWCSWEEVSSGSSYVTILNQNPSNEYMFLISKVF